jgi:hypothetical protein
LAGKDGRQAATLPDGRLFALNCASQVILGAEFDFD